jgi:hypothetical protein
MRPSFLLLLIGLELLVGILYLFVPVIRFRLFYIGFKVCHCAAVRT